MFFFRGRLIVKEEPRRHNPAVACSAKIARHLGVLVCFLVTYPNHHSADVPHTHHRPHNSRAFSQQKYRGPKKPAEGMLGASVRAIKLKLASTTTITDVGSAVGLVVGIAGGLTVGLLKGPALDPPAGHCLLRSLRDLEGELSDGERVSTKRRMRMPNESALN